MKKTEIFELISKLTEIGFISESEKIDYYRRLKTYKESKNEK